MDVVKVGVAPWMHMNPLCLSPSDQEVSCKVGAELDILYAVSTILNLTLSLVITNGTGCGLRSGEENRQDKWDGLLEMLRDGKIDIIGNFCDAKKLAATRGQEFFVLSSTIWQYQEMFVIQTPAPGPASFRLLAPFRTSVWIACVIIFLLYVSLIVFYRYLTDQTGSRFIDHVIKAQSMIRCLLPGSLKRLPPQITWPFWLLFLTLMFMFYSTYILSAVLQPFPVQEPFSSADEFTQALLSGEYRLISHKEEPGPPSACINKECGKVFNEAIKKHGIEYIPQVADQLPMIADQDPKSMPRYVLVDGTPFIELYFREFQKNRGRLWILNGEEYLTSSVYVWRRDFRYSKEFNRRLTQMGDFKDRALQRYLQLYGSQPYTGDRFMQVFGKESTIALSRIRALFYLYLGGMAAGIGWCMIEFVYARGRRGHFTLHWS